mgnify:CR=1 FL=1
MLESNAALSPDRTLRTPFRTFPDIPDIFPDTFPDRIGHNYWTLPDTTGHKPDRTGHKPDRMMCVHVQSPTGHSGHTRTHPDMPGHARQES